MKKRKIAVIIGSQSDLPQCLTGLEILRAEEQNGHITTDGVHIASMHRNTDYMFTLLERLYADGVDVIITGAGWANHLTGMADAYLRNCLHNSTIVVIGVAFEGRESAHTAAAVGSIKYVPGAQVVFDNFVGASGFARACKFAATGPLPQITAPQTKPPEVLTLEEAIAEAGKTDPKEQRPAVRTGT